MNPSTPAEIVAALLARMDAREPVAFDLGTPVPAESPAARQLVGMGAAILPQLLEALPQVEPNWRVAQLVQVVNQIGDARAIGPLRDLLLRYQQRPSKDPWDYAVIGQCQMALQRLETHRTVLDDTGANGER